MNTMGASGFARGMRRVWERLLERAGGTQRVVNWTLTFGAMALCSRARLGAGLAPFAAAYFAVSLTKGADIAALLAGCIAGAVLPWVTAASLYAPVGCAITLAMWLLWSKLRTLNFFARFDDWAFLPLTAGFSVLLPGLAAAGYAPLEWLIALGAAVAAALMMMGNWMRLRENITGAGLAIWACAAVIFTGELGLNPAPPAAFFAVACACAGKGALMGAALGGAGLLAGGDVTCVALACATGAAADLAHILRPEPVWRALAGASAAAVLCALRAAPLAAIFCCALAGFIPRGARDVLTRVLAPRRSGGEQIVAAFRRKAERELRALSDAFGELSDACGADDPAFGEQLLITNMRAALCTGCPDYAGCWPGANSRAVKLFCQLMTAAIERGGSPFEDGEVPPDILRLCRRGIMAPGRLGGMLSDFAAQRYRRVRLMEARRLIAAEFSQAAALINALAMEQARPINVRDGVAARAREALIEADLPVSDVTAIVRDRLELSVELIEPWTARRAAQAAEVLTQALGKSFSPGTSGRCTTVFMSGIAMNAPTAASIMPADPDAPSGDSHMVRDLGEGRLLVAISDGMGSGEAAAEESRRVLRLLHSLMSAGIPRELALSAVNGVMLARGGEEMFATVDMLMIDLCDGRAEFTKLSACRSYILSGGRVTAVEGGRLPLGILEDVEPGLSTVKLHPGDIVVMMTDGVADALPEVILEDLMLQSSEFSPSVISEALVNAAAARAPQRRDDMTAVCVKLEAAGA